MEAAKHAVTGRRAAVELYSRRRIAQQRIADIRFALNAIAPAKGLLKIAAPVAENRSADASNKVRDRTQRDNLEIAGRAPSSGCAN